jgi:hypothetical protein
MYFNPHHGIIQRIWLNFRATKIWAGRVVRNEEKARDHLWESVRWHTKEILFCMLLAFLMARVDKFQHFFAAFALDIKSPVQYDPLWKFVAILAGNALMIAWLCFVFWHKPKGVRLPFLFGKRLREGFERYYRKPGGAWRVATVSSLPFMLVDIALSLALLRKDNWEQQPLDTASSPQWLVNNTDWVILVCVFIFFGLSTLLRPRTHKKASLKHLWRILAQDLFLLFLAVSITIICLRYYNRFDHNLLIIYPVLLGFIFGPPLIVTFILNGFSACLIREKQECSLNHQHQTHHKPRKTLKFDRSYKFLQITSYLLSAGIFLLINNESATVEPWYSDWMFPIAMLLFIFMFYYQVLDFLLYNMTSLRFTALLIILFGSSMLFGRREHFKLKFTGENTSGREINRATLDEYFLTWAADRFRANPDFKNHPDTVYLVAAEGGGSRSGAWTSAVLTRLDERSGGRFRRNCFAISAVSGGAIGTAATLALWENANVKRVQDSTIYAPNSSKREGYVNTIFKRNYLSTALAGLFFYDFFQQIPGIHWMYPSHFSRTDRLQNDESNAVDLALQGVFPGTKKCRRDYLKKTNFLSLYYSPEPNDTTQALMTHLPLFFSNTCRVEDGRRGIVSPVQFDHLSADGRPERIFTAAVDVIGSAGQEAENKNRYLSLGEAASLSELFPYINSTVYVGENAGTFMDGGAYENLGLTTLYEIRKALGKIINSHNPNDALIIKALKDSSITVNADFKDYLRRLNFRTLTIYNYYNHGAEDRSYTNESNQLLNPLIALLHTPFTGHTDYIYHLSLHEYPNEMRDFPMIIPKDQRRYFTGRVIPDSIAPAAKDEQAAEIVMSRWLSKYELRNIMLEADKIRTVDDGWVTSPVRY